MESCRRSRNKKVEVEIRRSEHGRRSEIRSGIRRSEIGLEIRSDIRLELRGLESIEKV